MADKQAELRFKDATNVGFGGTPTAGWDIYIADARVGWLPNSSANRTFVKKWQHAKLEQAG